MLNRKYKFRVWLKDKNDPLYTCITGKRMIYEVENEYDYGSNGSPLMYENCFGDILANKEKYIVMQGLDRTDMYGKEMFEGDIVFDMLSDKFFVILYDGGAYYMFKPNTSISLEEINKKPIADCTCCSIRGFGIKVVGNLFEDRDKLDEWGLESEQIDDLIKSIYEER